MSQYEIIIYFSKIDGVYIAEVPELSGCMAHGATNEEALKNVNEAIELWLSTCEEFGNFIPEPKGRKLIFA